MQIYNTRPLLDIRPNFTGVDHGQLDDLVLSATGLGAVTPWKPSLGLKRQLRLPFLFSSKAEWRVFRDFIAARSGFLEGFWVPTYLGDYWLTGDISAGATVLTVERVGLADALSDFAQFKHLALIDRAQIRPFQIASVLASGNFESITLLNPVAGGAIATDTVCCGLLYCRLGAEIEYEYLSDGVIQATVDLVELPAEYVVASGSGYSGSPVLGSRPVYLYQIARGSQTWNYAGWGESLAVGDVWFVSENIAHESIRFATDFLNDDFSLSVATDRADHPFLVLLDRLNSQITTVTIYKTDAAAPALGSPFYSGRLGQTTQENNGIIRARIGSNLRVAERRIPGPQIQRTCVHRLFDDNCLANRTAFTTAGTISNLTDQYVQAAAFAAKETATGDPNWFALGVVTAGDEVRLCTGTDGTGKLYLNFPFRNAQPGAAISAEAGCNKRIGVCAGKFDNLNNFLGFPYIPNQNPQFQALQLPQKGGGKKS